MAPKLSSPCGAHDRVCTSWLGSDRLRSLHRQPGLSSIDLVLTAGSFGAFDTDWEDPQAELFFRRLASFARVIRFDRRGTRRLRPAPLDALPPWETFVEELECVMEAVGEQPGCAHGLLRRRPHGHALCRHQAGTHAALDPGEHQQQVRASDDYPTGFPAEAAEELNRTMAERWGSGEHVLLQVPSRANDERFKAWYGKKTRSIAGPAAAAAYFRAMFTADARSLLPAIHVPTLVLHRKAYRFMPIEHGQYLADNIEGARMVELAGLRRAPLLGPPRRSARRHRGVPDGGHPDAPTDRVLATVLYTDIVNSTRLLADMGDARWRGILDTHDDLAGRLAFENGGRLIKSTGDGILATFDGPGRGIRFATGFRQQLHTLSLTIRSGIHTGEVEIRGNDVGGMAVHLAARIMAEAGDDEILVSRTVKDLVVGLRTDFRRPRHLSPQGHRRRLAVVGRGGTGLSLLTDGLQGEVVLHLDERGGDTPTPGRLLKTGWC